MHWKWFCIGFLLVVIGCSSAKETAVSPNDSGQTVPATSTASPIEKTPIPLPAIPMTNRRVAQEPIQINHLYSFDGIPPIYDPEFVDAVDAPLQTDELILGIAWGNEAKAYPISVLRYREMVNDELAGIPTLVTW